MNNKDMMQNYFKIKKILDIALDYKRNDKLAQDLRAMLDTELTEKMQLFVEAIERKNKIQILN